MAEQFYFLWVIGCFQRVWPLALHHHCPSCCPLCSAELEYQSVAHVASHFAACRDNYLLFMINRITEILWDSSQRTCWQWSYSKSSCGVSGAIPEKEDHTTAGIIHCSTGAGTSLQATQLLAKGLRKRVVTHVRLYFLPVATYIYWAYCLMPSCVSR